MIGEPGQPSEKTLRNVAEAKAHSAHLGCWRIEWKFRTGRFFLWPHDRREMSEFFNEGRVYWIRWYWLTMGVSLYRAAEKGE